MTEVIKELKEAPDVTVDELLRTVIAQMFENDDDTSYLNAKLRASDGTESDLEFMFRLVSINGVETRTKEDDE